MNFKDIDPIRVALTGFKWLITVGFLMFVAIGIVKMLVKFAGE